MNKPIVLMALLGVSPFALSNAVAHAGLVAAKPAANATARPAPTELDLTFSEEVNVKFTGVTVIGPDQKRVTTGAGTLTDDGRTVTVLLPASLAAGAYRVEWHTLSADGHKTKGNYTFNIGP